MWKLVLATVTLQLQLQYPLLKSKMTCNSKSVPSCTLSKNPIKHVFSALILDCNLISSTTEIPIKTWHRNYLISPPSPIFFDPCVVGCSFDACWRGLVFPCHMFPQQYKIHCNPAEISSFVAQIL